MKKKKSLILVMHATKPRIKKTQGQFIRINFDWNLRSRFYQFFKEKNNNFIFLIISIFVLI